MKKYLLALLALTLLSCVLPGCGDKEPDEKISQKQNERAKKTDEQNGK